MGVAMDNVGLGLALGTAIGSGLGVALMGAANAKAKKGDKQACLLNRLLTWTEEGLLWECDPRQIEIGTTRRQSEEHARNQDLAGGA